MVEILRYPLCSVSCHLFLSSWILTIIDNLLVDFQFINADDVSATLKFNTLNKSLLIFPPNATIHRWKGKTRNQIKIYLMSFWLWIFYESKFIIPVEKIPKKMFKIFFSLLFAVIWERTWRGENHLLYKIKINFPFSSIHLRTNFSQAAIVIL